LSREVKKTLQKLKERDGSDKEKVRNVVGSQMLNWQSRNHATVNLLLDLLQVLPERTVG
jgi:hypothetical protein